MGLITDSDVFYYLSDGAKTKGELLNDIMFRDNILSDNTSPWEFSRLRGIYRSRLSAKIRTLVKYDILETFNYKGQVLYRIKGDNNPPVEPVLTTEYRIKEYLDCLEVGAIISTSAVSELVDLSVSRTGKLLNRFDCLVHLGKGLYEKIEVKSNDGV